MENYKILGVDENASIEEIERAYKNKVNEFKSEIKDERRAKAFIKIFDKAYEEIKAEREKIQNQQTMIMNIDEMNFIEYSEIDASTMADDKHQKIKDIDENEESPINYKKKKTYYSKNNIWSKKQKTNKKKTLKNSSKDKYEENIKKDNSKKVIIKQKEKSSSVSTLIKLPFKILALPVIALLSIIIFLCKILNLISWIASKIIIVAAISISAIHGYQIYLGHAIQYNIFILSALGFLVSLFLPSILRVVPLMLDGINIRLKRFVF